MQLHNIAPQYTVEYPKLGKPFGHGISKPLKTSHSSFSWPQYMRYRQVSFLRDFFFHNFALMRLKNLHLFSNLPDSVQFNTIWHRQYVIIFGLMQFSLD